MRIFISHSNRDEVPLDRLVKELKDAGHTVWYDRGGLKPGDQWREEIRRALHDAQAAVILFAENALTSSWVIAETTILTWRRAVDRSFVVIPVLLTPVTPEALRKAVPLEPSQI